MRHVSLPILLSILLAILACRSVASPAERLGEAVRIKTISYQDRSQIDYTQFDLFHAFLASTFPRVFREMEVETVNDYSLLLRWRGRDDTLRPVLFTAHMDVVPVEPGTEEDWQYPAFDGVVADRRVYGRGTLDDKVGVMSLLEAAEQLLAEGFSPSREIVLAFGHDEEIAGNDGALMLARRMAELDLQFDWMVDEGGLVVADNPLLPGATMAMVNVAEKGYLTLTLVAEGDGGHSSNPPAISTIGRLANALAVIEANPFPARLVEPVAAMFEALAPHVGQPQQLVFENLWLTGGMVAGQMADDRLTMPYVRTTTALTMFNAGIKENVVPQRAEAKVNFRLLPGDTPETVVNYIEELVDDPQVTIEYDQWDKLPPVADTSGSGFEVISRAVEAVYPGVVVVPSLLTATTDTRHYIEVADNLYRFHGMLVEAGQAKSIHGTNEYIDVASYEKTIEVARQMMTLGAGEVP
jgi:carboxypeptidase PM20D1